MHHPHPALGPDEVLAVRHALPVNSDPDADALAFAEALFKALAEQTRVSEKLEALGWQQVQCDLCGDMARAAPSPSPGLQRNALRYIQLRQLVEIEGADADRRFVLPLAVPADDAQDFPLLDKAVDASLKKWVPADGESSAECEAEAPSTESPPPSCQVVHRPTVRALLRMFEVENNADGFHYNEFNHYGLINLRLSTGPGDPRQLYLGEEVMGKYAGKQGPELRGTGRHRLNDAAIDLVVNLLTKRTRGWNVTMRPSPLDERIRRAQAIVAAWSPAKLASMQLQGEDPYQVRQPAAAPP